jgi:hypothetical protein
MGGAEWRGCERLCAVKSENATIGEGREASYFPHEEKSSKKIKRRRKRV